MSTSENSVDEIRRRMAELRHELAHDVQDVGRSTKAMGSPSYYMRKFPWATLAVAAGAGYLLIPKKKKATEQINTEVLAELLREKHLHIDTMKAEESPGVIKTLAVMGVTWAAKTGMNYLLDQLTTVATNAVAKSKESNEVPSPSIDEPLDINI